MRGGESGVAVNIDLRPSWIKNPTEDIVLAKIYKYFSLQLSKFEESTYNS